MLTRAYRHPCRAISSVFVSGSSCTGAASKVTRVGAAVVRGGSDALQLALSAAVTESGACYVHDWVSHPHMTGVLATQGRCAHLLKSDSGQLSGAAKTQHLLCVWC
jgi:hypothetical protein